MRIVGGEWSSRVLETRKGMDTRPTLDKVKEAVFSSLGGKFSGGIVLDLYAGSGAIGLEALSRGMEKAIFVDQDPDAIRVIQKNIASLKAEDRCQVLHCDAMVALQRCLKEGIQFALVYLDPPYARQENQAICQFLVQNGMIESDADIVIESAKEDEYPDFFPHLYKRKEANYGITKITYYKGV